MNSEKPPKHILVAVIGTTPQIITETLYALIVQRNIPAPYAIYVITTSEGKRQAIQLLLNNGEGQYFRFCRDYGIDATKIAFDESSFLVARDAENRPLKDIRTTADNENMADFIVNFIREKTIDDSVIVHASAAGGRKTMSVYLSFAMSLFAHNQDKLYHVLVSPKEFEDRRDFFYIPKEPIKLNDMTITTADASIDLAEIPFVRLRDKLEHFEFPSKASYKYMVALSQKEVNLMLPMPEIVIDETICAITINGSSLRLEPLDCAVYTAFLDRKINNCIRPDLNFCGDCVGCFQDMQEILFNEHFRNKIFAFYEQLTGKTKPYYEKSYNASNSQSWHREKISRINTKISEQFKDRHIERLCSILPDREKQGKKYGIFIDKRKILVKKAPHSPQSTR